MCRRKRASFLMLKTVGHHILNASVVTAHSLCSDIFASRIQCTCSDSLIQLWHERPNLQVSTEALFCINGFLFVLVICLFTNTGKAEEGKKDEIATRVKSKLVWLDMAVRLRGYLMASTVNSSLWIWSLPLASSPASSYLGSALPWGSPL